MLLVQDTPAPTTASSAAYGARRAFRSEPVVAPAPASSALRMTAPDDLSVFEWALRVLLSPLDYPDWRAWRVEAHRALLTLSGAEALALYVPFGDEREAWYGSGALSALPAGRATVLADAADLPDVVMARVDFGAPAPAELRFTSGVPAREQSPTAVASANALLRAVLPALRTGLATWWRALAQRSDVARVLDGIRDAALLFDASGTLVHANPSAARLADGVTGARVRAEAQRLAWSLAAIARRRGAAAQPEPATREIREGTVAYALRATPVAEGITGRGPGVLVTVEAGAPAPMDDVTLRQRFGLTKRELMVARLLDEGLSNAELAERLGVSVFTARNHVERLLGKLGVPRRTRVGAVLRGEAA